MWSAHRMCMIAAGIDAIDDPFGDFKSDRGYIKQTTYAATLGTVGKWCIHPNQIPLAQRRLRPLAQGAVLSSAE